MDGPLTRYKPNSVSPPGSTIKDLLSDHYLHETHLAEALQISLEETYDLLRGTKEIDKRIAQNLEDVFGTSAEYWLGREASYQKHLRERRTKHCTHTWKHMSGEVFWCEECGSIAQGKRDAYGVVRDLEVQQRPKLLNDSSLLRAQAARVDLDRK